MGAVQRLRIKAARRRGDRVRVSLVPRGDMTMAEYYRVCELIALDPDELLCADPTTAERIKRGAQCPRSLGHGQELLRLVYENGRDIDLRQLTREAYQDILGYAAADFIYGSTQSWRRRLSESRKAVAKRGSGRAAAVAR